MSRPTIGQHLERVQGLAASRRVEVEKVAVETARGLVLAADAVTARPVPPFANSAMDGFAVHAASLVGPGPWTFPVVGDVAAGAAALACPVGAAVRVMTGAPVPEGEDIVVVPVEQTNVARGPQPLPATVRIIRVDPARSHVRQAGSSLAVGSVAAPAGSLVDAGLLAALISAGVRHVDVWARPRVAVVSTGDELVAWPLVPAEGQLSDSNQPMIAALCEQNGAASVERLRSGDNPAFFASLLDHAARECDLVLTTGGISAGAFDVVREVLEPTDGAWFGEVAQRPGGPQGVALWGGTPVVCLPGNPVAAYVSFHLYIVPLLASFRGLSAPFPVITARTGEGFRPSRSAVPRVVPVRLDFSGEQPTATPFSANVHSASDVGALGNIDGYVVLDPEAMASNAVPESLKVYLTRS
ncbi:molybdopterin molybdotransferase MoeA [Corynebacterium mayonis]|uniref:molybdopterin molybdotransferase MoeA n=1 Tax=Corynebacterium mayonis TaxID=3062461 RepID=UPI0031408658